MWKVEPKQEESEQNINVLKMYFSLFSVGGGTVWVSSHERFLSLFEVAEGQQS